MARKRISEMNGVEPAGSARIPYDQTDPMQQMGAPAQASGPTGAALPASALPPGAPDLGALGQGQDPGSAPDLSGMGLGGGQLGGAPNGGAPAQGLGGGQPADAGAPALGAAQSTDDLTGNDLAALGQPVTGLQSPEEQQVAQMEQALNDPNTPPNVVQQLQQILDLAARRQLAGLGGQSQGGGLGA